MGKFGAGRLDRKLQFRASVSVDDGLAVAQVWQNFGPVYPCGVVQFREQEQDAGGQVQAVELTKFTVRYDSFTSLISPRNRIIYDGSEYEIVGRREAPNTRRSLLELTAAARADLP